MRYRQILEACWKGYTQKGMKSKGGRMVPNCVKSKSESVKEMARGPGDSMLSFNKFALPKLKELGFRGPYKLGDLPRVAKLFKNHDDSWYNDEFDNDSNIMVKGNNASNFEFVAIPSSPLYGESGYVYGDAYSIEGGYDLAKLIKMITKDYNIMRPPPKATYYSDTAYSQKIDTEEPLDNTRRSYSYKISEVENLSDEQIEEDLRKWFKEKWVRFGPDGKIRGDCARGSSSEGKPKCLPQSKAHNLGKKGRASAAARKRREDPNPERSGKAKNVATKSKRDKK